MNINDVNNPLVSGELAKGSQLTGKKDTGLTEGTTDRDRVQRQGTGTQAAQGTPARPIRDVYESDEIRQLAAELTKTIENNEPEPREEAVNRASERVQSGYYNSKEFMGNLAAKLVDTGVVR